MANTCSITNVCSRQLRTTRALASGMGRGWPRTWALAFDPSFKLIDDVAHVQNDAVEVIDRDQYVSLERNIKVGSRPLRVSAPISTFAIWSGFIPRVSNSPNTSPFFNGWGESRCARPKNLPPG